MSIDDQCPGCGVIIRHGPSRSGSLVDCPKCGRSIRLPSIVVEPPPLIRTESSNLQIGEAASIVGTIEMVRAMERINENLCVIRRYIGWIAVAIAIWFGIFVLAALGTMMQPSYL